MYQQWLGALTFIALAVLLNGCSDNKSCPTCVKPINPVQRDTIPPRILSVQPVNGDSNVSITSAIVATFSKPLNPASVTPASFTLTQGVQTVSGALTVSGAIATFTPSQPLSYKQSYSAIVTTAVRDMDGNSMSNPYSWSFVTVKDPSLWSVDTNSALVGLALDTSGFYFIGETKTYRFDAISGKFDVNGRGQWVDTVSTPDYDQPRCVAVSGGKVYVLRWRDPTGLGSAAIYVDSHNALTGRLQWSVQLATSGTGSCVAADSSGVYAAWIAGGVGFLAKLNTVNGSATQTVDLGDVVPASIAVSPTGVYVGGTMISSGIFAVAYSKDLSRQQWLKRYHASILETGGYVTVTANAVVLAGDSYDPFNGGGPGSLVWSYSQATGDSLWVISLNGKLNSTIQGVTSDSAGNIYVLPGPAKLRPDGKVAWVNPSSPRTGDGFFSSAVVKNDTLYGVDGSNRVWRLNASTGAKLQ